MRRIGKTPANYMLYLQLPKAAFAIGHSRDNSDAIAIGIWGVDRQQMPRLKAPGWATRNPAPTEKRGSLGGVLRLHLTGRRGGGSLTEGAADGALK